MKKCIGISLLAILSLACASYNVLAVGEPLIQATLAVYPTTIAPGNDGYIQITLRNSGTAAANRISISSITTDAPIKYSWNTELGSLNAGDSTTAIFKFSVLENASPGLYSLTFTIDYCQDSICKTIYPTALINVQSPGALEITSVKPSSLKLGEKANMTFTILNRGSSITNVIFTWVSTDGALLPIGSTNRVVIPVINANSYYEVRSEVVVSPTAVPGIHPISISIQYLDKAGMNQTVTSVTGIEVSSETDFDVSLQDYSSGTATLAIANVGSTTAYSTVVRIPPQQAFRTIGASSSVLGNLNAGDYTLTSFQLVPTRPNATEKLLVEISYTDLLGVRRTIQKEVLFTAFNTTAPFRRTISQPFLGSNSITYIVIGIVGIACILTIIKLGKRIRKR
jgi:hypothetical protein